MGWLVAYLVAVVVVVRLVARMADIAEGRRE